MRIAFVGDSLTLGVPGCSYLAFLRRRLNGHTLINLGQADDTTVSLYRRVAALPFDEPFDVAFLWVGVNDVDRRRSWSFRVVERLINKPRARNLDEFRAHYGWTLDLLSRNARRVIAVSPLLKGENADNEWNRRLGVLSAAIADLASRYERVEYLDLRAVFVRELASRPTSDYLPKSPFHVALDALTLRSREQIDGKAAARGLHLTLDGVHLNCAGAEIVARVFAQAIAQAVGRAVGLQ